MGGATGARCRSSGATASVGGRMGWDGGSRVEVGDGGASGARCLHAATSCLISTAAAAARGAGAGVPEQPPLPSNPPRSSTSMTARTSCSRPPALSTRSTTWRRSPRERRRRPPPRRRPATAACAAPPLLVVVVVLLPRPAPLEPQPVHPGGGGGLVLVSWRELACSAPAGTARHTALARGVSGSRLPEVRVPAVCLDDATDACAPATYMHATCRPRACPHADRPHMF